MEAPIGIDPVPDVKGTIPPSGIGNFSFVKKYLHWTLRIIFFLIRITILILIIIPGAIPAIIIAGIYYLLKAIDPRDIIINDLEKIYHGSLGRFDMSTQILLFVGLILVFVSLHLYLKSKEYEDKRFHKVALAELRQITVKFFKI